MDKKKVAAVALVGVLAAGGTAVGINHVQGPMQVSEDAQKIHNKTVNDDTVAYYHEVCSALSDLHAIPLNFVDSSLDTLGLSPEEKASRHKTAAENLKRTAGDVTHHLQAIDSQAPTVRQVNGVPYDYRGALTPVIDQAGTYTAVFDKVLADPRWGSQDAEEVGNATREATSSISTWAGDTTQAAGSLGEKAPVLSEATHESMTRIPECRMLTGGEFSGEEKQSIVVQDVVSAYSLLDDSYGKIQDKLARLDEVDGSGAVSADVVQTQLADIWADVAQEAGHAADAYDAWHVTAPRGTPEYRAGEKAGEFIHPEVPRELQHAAQEYSDAIRTAGPETLNSVVMDSEASQRARQAQIELARTTTHGLTAMEMPTAATAKAVEDRQQ